MFIPIIFIFLLWITCLFWGLDPNAVCVLRACKFVPRSGCMGAKFTVETLPKLIQYYRNFKPLYYRVTKL